MISAGFGRHTPARSHAEDGWASRGALTGGRLVEVGKSLAFAPHLRSEPFWIEVFLGSSVTDPNACATSIRRW